MTLFDVLQITAFIAALFIVTPLLGTYIANVFERTRQGRVERAIYRVTQIDAAEEQPWTRYAMDLIWFNAFGLAFVFALQLLQSYLPGNPQALANVSWHSALNTAVSFVTNTNWQGYSGEVTMSYLTQMLALATQNFLSAATGIAVAIALSRAIARKQSPTIGNVWSDLTRSTIYILLPLSFLFALILIGQGVVQTFSPSVTATTLEGVKQIIPLGPAASQVAIKMIGTNGGGFFNANAAHPFENPTGLSNFLQMLAMIMIPAALTYTFGKIVKSQRQGWALFAAMFTLFIVGLAASLASEYATNSVLHTAAAMEGKETRFGVMNSVLFSVLTTDMSCGAVNAMHSSLSPLSGLITLFNMSVNEVIFGGVGAGLYGMLLFVLLTVFLAGLMVGRTPEYLGKKIESWEMKMVILSIIGPSAVILIGAGLSVVLPIGLSSLANKGPHGLTEILYAFTSAGANNGSAFAGLYANTVWYNLWLAGAMLIGRFAILIPALAVAGSLAKKKIAPPSSGTFTTDSFIFVVLLIGVIVIEVALTFVPAWSLGPIVEHFLMLQGKAF